MMSALGIKTARLTASRFGDILLWLATAFPWMLMTALIVALLSLAPAHAEEAASDSCGGKDLMAELQKSDPAKYASILAEGDKVANGKGIFWKIEKSGLKPSWLLGTMHVSDARVVTMPKGAAEASAGADTIVVESDEILDDKKAMAALFGNPSLMMLTDGSTISQHLSPEENAKLEAGLKQRGVSLATVAHMQPWLISSSFEMTGCEVRRKTAGMKFLDQKLASDAIASGKQVKGLETLAEQAKAMSDLPIELHVKSLIQTLELGDKINDVNETMTDLYLAGNIGAIVPMLKNIVPDQNLSDDDTAAFEQRIILDRNKVMAERAAPILAKGNAFIAVGALHLVGDQGLVELLRKQGFTVTAAN
ncbi:MULTISPECIES: TraB/GumN family protein [unclassified Rhizobium]|uniref:TraB/GumN family protein n=1 Tax=unclassified Rhizobium TaxID=2613769 RepID=UPI000CF1FAA6|nr:MULTISPECIES: TraB/GumN family protein [Rhizobium]MDK4739749.1 TraB/GumN family protein [Rhizobium sp. CNPSo 3464]UWU23362.1 TraB/GumN family protein [Rhizobium tropici]